MDDKCLKIKTVSPSVPRPTELYVRRYEMVKVSALIEVEPPSLARRTVNSRCVIVFPFARERHGPREWLIMNRVRSYSRVWKKTLSEDLRNVESTLSGQTGMEKPLRSGDVTGFGRLQITERTIYVVCRGVLYASRN